ncbi:cyclin-dependent kinase inhibitor 3 family protein [Thauera sp. 2A1]|uniref:cyclin-dependent kinase inhibitor 3 family protein n=1 Tax=Thauera sp. 2A1 TaxID=2570191 RepID=UPI001290C680|nr:cyclin-dependent kinase inhibitor 3 family protein [Thauera sp. 2A1]KAI5912136.1 cyclin-dependent kinase inhibitor 3 family protein [Thauera sp. 2A1]KAI5915125.1 cyclin-dependent kinase inhibitor 3 family protein [Thauera sp. 2A1]
MKEKAAPVRTSRSDPLHIDEVIAGEQGGRIGITFCPGKTGPSLYDFRWERDLAVDLGVIVGWGARAVVTLLEEHELALLGVPELGAQVRSRGLDWHHLPIPDVQPPGAQFEAGWQTSGPVLCNALLAGHRVLVHCRGGLGRAGTVAARLLVELGMPAVEAIGRVRSARPGAIETAEQEQYVLNLPRRRGAGS